MKKIIIILLAFLLNASLLFAQSRFTTSGTIEYEKSINVFAIARANIARQGSFQSMFSTAFEQYQKTHTQFLKYQSTLSFSNGKALFTPTPSTEVVPGLFANAMMKQSNTVYTDFTEGKRIMQKEVLDGQFLVTDSLSKIKWRLTDQTDVILGYTCRRANGLIQDSLYVVAFYTDKIRVSGGPESFSGLPGMILKVMLPHEHLTWTATKVLDTTLPANTIVPPKKGKLQTREQFYNTLKEVFRNNNAQMKAYML